MSLALRVVGEDDRALADAELLDQVLVLLISNATKHFDPSGEVRLRVNANTITVEDKGERIGLNDLPRVFERFYRGKENSGGFSLGLSICRKLVERMGGSVSIDSREGMGTMAKIEPRKEW